MKKRFGFLFAIYCIIIISLLALALVFLPRGSKTQNYADSLMLSIPRGITININEQVKLKDDFIIVSPSYLKDKISYQITSRSDKNHGGLTFNDNTLKATIVGSYDIKFSVPGKKADINEYMLVTVTRENEKADLLKPVGKQNESFDISEVLSFNSTLEHKIWLDDSGVATFNDATFYFNEVGKFVIYVEFYDSYAVYKYLFEVIVVKDIQPEPESYIIKINDIYKINEYVLISYSVLPENGSADVDQTITVDIVGNAVCENVIPPLIYIIPNSNDFFTVKIYSPIANITKEITVNIAEL